MIDSLAFVSIMYMDVNSSKVHKKLANYYESIGDLNHASKEYLSLAYISPLDVSSYYYAADLAYKAEDYTNAIRYLKESPHSDTSTYAQFTLASIYAAQKNNNEALASIERLQYIPLNSTLQLQVQKLKYKVLKDSGLNSEAEKTLTDIKKIDPSFNNLTTANRMTILIPNSIRPYIDRAEALRKNGQYSEAIGVLKDANRIHEIPYTNLLIGKLLFSQRKIEAVAYLEKAKKEMKGDPSLEYCLSVLYLIKRDIPKAKASIDEFVKLQGENDPQLLQLRRILKKVIAENKTSH